MSYLIEANDIVFKYGSQKIVYDFNIAIEPREIITIIGPVGCGKTSVIKMLSGIMKPYHGVITKKKDLVIGYMPQKTNFNPNIPILVSEFLELSGRKPFTPKTIYQKLDIAHLLNKQIHVLSPGELKLVLLARALIMQPDLLLLDEPICSMDVNTQDQFYQLLDEIRTSYNCSIIMTSHDLRVVMRKSDYVICMNRHICCKGKPVDVSQHPEFISLFGSSFSVYTHHHDHPHDLLRNPNML